MQESQDSVYLYAKQSREKYLEVFTHKRCPHMFKVMPFLDSEKKNSSEESFLSLHLQSCEQCREQALKTMEQFKKIEHFIPNVSLNPVAKENLEKFHSQLITKTRWDLSWSFKLSKITEEKIVPGLWDFLSVFKKPLVILSIVVASLLIYF